MSEKIYAGCSTSILLKKISRGLGSKPCNSSETASRDEKEFFPCLRLWLYLIVGLAISTHESTDMPKPASFGASAPTAFEQRACILRS